MRRPSFSGVVVVVGGLALVALVVLGVAGRDDSGDSALAGPEPAEQGGDACTFWHGGHSHEGSLLDEECVASAGPHEPDTAHAAEDFDFTVDPAELVPAAPGAMPPGMPSFDMLTGEPVANHMPAATPQLIAWSDWCFFGTGGDAPGSTPWACSQQLAHFAWALTPAEQGGIAADQSCVLEQERLYLQTMATAGSMPGEIIEAHGWHRCASIIDPLPGDGRSMVDKCSALAASDPRVQAFLDTFYGDCAAWADSQQFIIDTFGAPACSEAARLSVLWRQSVLTDTEMQAVAHLSLC